eukprot:8175212-Ditylum_brightwellii.AAC.1
MTPQLPNQSNQVNDTISTPQPANATSTQQQILNNGSANPGQESNLIRAANFLQLANGNFVVRITTFNLSSRVFQWISVQSYQQCTGYKGKLWIDSGTNVSVMGSSFKMIQDTCRYANMTDVANNLVKIVFP